MAEGREPFLKRWARLKSEQPKPEPPEPTQETAPPVAAPVTSDAADASPEVPPEDLPPIEELTADSDFTPFLKAGVPEELKRLALRKLWRSDPVFANLDGLVEYGEDFGAAFRNPGPVATLFRIGRGMPGPGDAEEEDPKEEAAVEADEQSAVEEQEQSPTGPGPEEGGSDLPVARKDEQSTTG
jgi:hypothetical protein